MAGKKDFMSELANEIEAQKQGKRTKLDDVSDFVPKQRTVSSQDYQEIQIEQPQQAPVKKEVVVTPEPVVEPESEPYEEEYVDEVDDHQALFERATAFAKPGSFEQESFQKVEKPKRTISPIGWALLAASLLLIAGLVWWFAFAAKITLPDFVGQNISEVSTWARQNKMESGVVATKEEYSMEFDKDIVISQSIEGGKKVKPNTPITFVVSIGADPQEAVSFPGDLKAMTLDEVREWVSENKLSKTKITTQNSTTVPDGGIISYEIRNGSEDEFTRGTTLNIVASKGPAPAQQVTLDNLVGKSIEEVETWARNKKIEVKRAEAFNETVEAGKIVSMDHSAGTTLNEGDTLMVVVSKGKGVAIPNLVGYTKEQFEAWQMGKYNNVTVVPKSIYNEAPEGMVIAQNLAPGSMVESGTVLEVTISLYLPIIETNSKEWIGKDYLELKYWVDDKNSKGARLQAGQYADYKDPVYCATDSTGQPYADNAIVDIKCFYGTSDLEEGCGRPLTLDSRISYLLNKCE